MTIEEAIRSEERAWEIKMEYLNERQLVLENAILDILNEIEDGEESLDEQRETLEAMIDEAEELGVYMRVYRARMA